MDEEGRKTPRSTVVSALSSAKKSLIPIVSVLQWWFFNVATVILNKYIFQGASSAEIPGSMPSVAPLAAAGALCIS